MPDEPLGSELRSAGGRGPPRRDVGSWEASARSLRTERRDADAPSQVLELNHRKMRLGRASPQKAEARRWPSTACHPRPPPPPSFPESPKPVWLSPERTSDDPASRDSGQRGHQVKLLLRTARSV